MMLRLLFNSLFVGFFGVSALLWKHFYSSIVFNTQLISYIFYEKLNVLNGERNNTNPKLSIIQKARKPCIKSRIKEYLPFQRLVDEDASLVSSSPVTPTAQDTAQTPANRKYTKPSLI
ncbi:hypothetical protein I7I48_00667 [Histoplasma ohiense]|nr:hypothetical protein I7I48_00667 [Histoplasma ohiense (nom. inval.)]